jgi:hypothetical protein
MGMGNQQLFNGDAVFFGNLDDLIDIAAWIYDSALH